MINLQAKSRNLITSWNALELNNKKIILIILICAVIFYLDFAFALKMQLRTIGKTTSKITALKKDIDSLNKNLVLMQQAQNKQASTRKVIKIIPESHLPKLFQKISDIANKYNVKIMELKPSKDTKTKAGKTLAKGDFIPISITLDISGGYHDLGRFLNDSENADEFIAVENLRILPQQDPFRQKVNILLKTYVEK